MPGFVSIISAGPGDPELLTLRAAKRLAAAEVILFDDLARGPILDLAAPGARVIAVGKRAGRPSPRQEDISRLLVAEAQTGAQVVRLKSGDAGIFGRLEEEITALAAAGIGYEVIPGVTSACAAAAALGLPLTRRLTARRLQFVTGADVTGGLPVDLNWAALADPGVVTVIYMGQRTFPALAAGLVARGLSPDSPAILAHGVSTPEEDIRRFTLESLAVHLQGQSVTAPGLIILGPLQAAP